MAESNYPVAVVKIVPNLGQSLKPLMFQTSLGLYQDDPEKPEYTLRRLPDDLADLPWITEAMVSASS